MPWMTRDGGQGEIIALADRMLGGDRVALARLITLVENRAPGLPAVMSRIYPRTGRAHVIGITGPPGAGKSTLTDRVTARLRAAGKRVGIVAVDPSSPFSGGAVLGTASAGGALPRPRRVIAASRAARPAVSRAHPRRHTAARAFAWSVLVDTVGVGNGSGDRALPTPRSSHLPRR